MVLSASAFSSLPFRAMPVPPLLPDSLVLPKRRMMSARPSELVSRSAMRYPPGGTLRVVSYGECQVLAYMTPRGPAAMWRGEPRLSANTVAVKPGGSLSCTPAEADAVLLAVSALAAVVSETDRLRSPLPQP